MKKSSRELALASARAKLYSIAGGSHDSGDPRASRMTLAQRIDFIDSKEFRDYIAAERDADVTPFWKKDVDKTQGAGDVFTFMFKHRADNGMFSPRQLKEVSDFLRARSALKRPRLKNLTPYALLAQWQAHEEGGEGVEMMEFWRVYWKAQLGLTREEKLAQVASFAPSYAAKVFPGVREENQLLTEVGVEVVIVSNGDQELAIAISPYLGVKPQNVVGSHLKYDDKGVSIGVNHSYEVFGDDWLVRPQPGKNLSFHYWLHANRKRFFRDRINEDRFVIVGRDGDSGSTDGGMMIHGHPATIGNFMVEVPGEPGRVLKFQQMMAKYGWTCGNCITLVQEPSRTGFLPD
jgi:hypothetical protein